MVFGRREVSQLAVALDEPERCRDDTDANSRVAGFQPLQRSHRNPQYAVPRSSRTTFFAMALNVVKLVVAYVAATA